MLWLERRIPPPVVALVVAVAMAATARALAPLAALWLTPLAIALAGVGFLSGVAGVVTFRRAGANIDPVHVERGETLVTSGPYRLTRNPMYLGLATALVGLTVYLARPVELLGPLIFVLYVTRYQIGPEERAMAAKFGASYEKYRRRVRRWL